MRQRTPLPLQLEVTSSVRKGQLALHFDEGAQAYMQSIYAECGLHDDVRWLGQPVGVAPADLVSLQDILLDVRPAAIIMIGVAPGLVGFVDHALMAIPDSGTRMLCVTPMPSEVMLPERATALHGRADDAFILAAARRWIGSAESVLVLHASDPATGFSVATLRDWGELVSFRSYLACLGTLFGQPFLGYSQHQHLRAIRQLVAGDAPFVIDHSRNRQLISTCPSGYLRKVGGMLTAANYDSALDDLDPVLAPLPEYHA